MINAVNKTKTFLTTRKLRKVAQHEWIGGVCAGVAYWLGVPVWLTRLAWFCSVFFYGVGVVVYILLLIFMPTWDKTPKDYKEVTGD